MIKHISRTVVILSLISFFTDIASEMLYPVMPMFLTSIGFSVALIGMLEGAAEAVAGLSKGFFGQLSDTLQRREPFVKYGYSLSAVSKPMMAAATFPVWIFCARLLDRLGKGIRTAPRDAILSAETTSGFKGRVFGFHRGFDTAGAAIGPAAALLFLLFYPEHYRTLFLLAFIPGIFASGLTFVVREKKVFVPNRKRNAGFFSFLFYWKSAPPGFRLLSSGLLFFALMNSSDVLLLLMVKHQGASDLQVIGIYIFYNLIYALTSYPAGMLGDRIGLKKTFLIGLILFAVVYGCISFTTSPAAFIALFFLYGIYAACTEGVSKAWISNLVPHNEVATAIGFYTGMQSICTLCASSFAGWLWFAFSPSVAFFTSAAGTLAVILYFIFAFRSMSEIAGI